MKKTTVFLAALALASIVSVPVCAKDIGDYTDVASDAWFYEYAKDMSANELMTGLDRQTFGAGQDLERGQFATVLYRAVGKPDTSYEQRFGDVADGQFYSQPVIWANNAGITTGYENGLYGVSDKITREQFATMLYRYSQQQEWDTTAMGDVSSFPDGNQVSNFAAEAMQWAVGTGIISGNADGTLAPQGNVSRAVCATLVSRFKNSMTTTLNVTMYNSRTDNTVWQPADSQERGYKVTLSSMHTEETYSAEIEAGSFYFENLKAGIYSMSVDSYDKNSTDGALKSEKGGAYLFVPMEKEFTFSSYWKDFAPVKVNVYDNQTDKNKLKAPDTRVGDGIWPPDGISFNFTGWDKDGDHIGGLGIGNIARFMVVSKKTTPWEVLFDGYVPYPDMENPEYNIYIN